MVRSHTLTTMVISAGSVNRFTHRKQDIKTTEVNSRACTPNTSENQNNSITVHEATLGFVPDLPFFQYDVIL